MSNSVFGLSPFKAQQVYKSTFNQPSISGMQLHPLSPAVIVVSQNNPNDDSIITISWGAVTSAQSYRIMVNGVQISTVTNTSYTYTADKNGVYSIYVRAFGEGYKYSKSNQVVVNVSSHGRFLSTGIKYILGNLKKLLIRK